MPFTGFPRTVGGIPEFCKDLAGVFPAVFLPGRPFGQNALKRAAVHVEAARSLADVAVAEFKHPLDVLPPNAVR